MHEGTNSLEERCRSDVEFRDDGVAVDDLDAQLLDTADDDAVRITHAATEQTLDVYLCTGDAAHEPGIRSTM